MERFPRCIDQIAQLNEQFNQSLRAPHSLIRMEVCGELVTLFQRKTRHKIAPASTLKMFLLDELLKTNTHLSKDTVEIEEKHVRKGSGNNLEVGHHYYLRDLIDNLTVSSSNTAAMVLQDYLEIQAGIDLVAHVNKSNAHRGMTISHFKNLHGLPERGQGLNLNDFSKFLDEKLFDDVFLEKLRIPAIEFESLEGGKVKEKNTFSLFTKFKTEILGVKTGTLVPNVYNIVIFFQIGQQRGYLANFLNANQSDQKYDASHVIQQIKTWVGD